MKIKYLIILFFPLIVSQCTPHPEETDEFYLFVTVTEKLTPEKVGYKPEAKKNEKNNFFVVNIDICNNTNSVINFWTMSCSWEVNYVFNTKELYLYNQGCDFNSPIVKQIKPKEKLTYKGIICVKESLKIPITTKLGFVVIHEKETDFSDFNSVLGYKIKEEKDVIWSNYFVVK